MPPRGRISAERKQLPPSTPGVVRTIRFPGGKEDCPDVHRRGRVPQIKGKAFAAAGCQNAVDSQYQHDHDQCCHHDLGDPLYTLLQAHGQNKKAHNDGYGHKAPLTDGRSHHIAEFGSDSLRIQAFKGSGRRRMVTGLA